MKTIKFKNYKVLSVLVLAVLSLSSCLKDPRYINFAGSPPLIEFPLAANNVNKAQVVTWSISGAGATYNLPITINLASPAVLTVPTTFTISIDNGTIISDPTTSTAKTSAVTPATTTTPIPTYFLLPAADYTASGLSGTIPAGQRTATMNIAFNGSLIGTTIKNYALRLTITSGSQQISNWNITTLLVQPAP